MAVFQKVLLVTLFRIAGSVYDFLAYVHPVIGMPHDGMMFSTRDADNDPMVTYNCGLTFGGGWWFTRCSLWTPTTSAPSWYSIVDQTSYYMQKIHIMVKLQ